MASPKNGHFFKGLFNFLKETHDIKIEMLWVNFETLFLRPWERFSDQPFLLEVSLGHCMVIVDGPNNMPWRGQLFNEAPMELSSKAAVFF